MEDILLRTKEAIPFRSSSAPGAVGCLLLYFILRHKRMFSIDNVKTMCEKLNTDVKCGWEEAVSSSGQRANLKAIKLQKIPKTPKENKGTYIQ